MSRILVTPRSLSSGSHSSLARLKNAGLQIVTPAPGATPSPDQLKEHLPGCVGWLAGVEPVSEDVINHGPDLKVISRNGSGIDNLPVAYIQNKGIELKTAVGSNARGVAELTIALMLSVLRSIPQCDRGIRAWNWPRIRGRELSSLTIGVVGLGAIGRVTSELCVLLGARVLAHDPFVSSPDQTPDRVEPVSLERLFQTCDVMTFHCPAPEDNKPLLNRAMLENAKQGLVIVNTARAGLIDEDAVLDALNTGQVFGLATDVFEREPPDLSALLTHERVISTSHIGAFTAESVARAADAAVANILDSLGLA